MTYLEAVRFLIAKHGDEALYSDDGDTWELWLLEEALTDPSNLPNDIDTEYAVFHDCIYECRNGYIEKSVLVPTEEPC